MSPFQRCPSAWLVRHNPMRKSIHRSNNDMIFYRKQEALRQINPLQKGITLTNETPICLSPSRYKICQSKVRQCSIIHPLLKRITLTKSTHKSVFYHRYTPSKFNAPSVFLQVHHLNSHTTSINHTYNTFSLVEKSERSSAFLWMVKFEIIACAESC